MEAICTAVHAGLTRHAVLIGWTVTRHMHVDVIPAASSLSLTAKPRVSKDEVGTIMQHARMLWIYVSPVKICHHMPVSMSNGLLLDA